MHRLPVLARVRVQGGALYGVFHCHTQNIGLYPYSTLLCVIVKSST